MRKAVLLLVYAFLFMMIGRNLTFLPHLSSGPKQVEAADLKQTIQEYIKTQKVHTSVYYKNLDTQATFGIDENTIVTAASLNKLIIIAYLYSQVAQKKIDPDDTVVIQDEDIQDYGTGVIRYEEPGKAYSLRTLAKLTLENSDNTAAHVLSVRLGPDNTQSYADSLGLFATNMQDNKTTAAEMGKLLELIYGNKITSPILTNELLDFMKDTEFEDRLARNLKGKARVYHKTGDAVRMIHDAGIIDGNGQKYILVVLTSDVEDEDKAKEMIGKIAELTFSSEAKK